MKRFPLIAIAVAVIAIFITTLPAVWQQKQIPAGREQVVFWHFWGGQERLAVQQIVQRFNASQEKYWVEEIPVPGQNLDMKFYMAIAGGKTPDLLNQDDQIVAQWAERGVLMPIRELAEDDNQYVRLQHWLIPSAKKIGTCNGELYALCNAIDIRALFYRTDALRGLPPPESISELDRIAKVHPQRDDTIPYLPDDRRLWAWGVAFGGDFYNEATKQVTVNHPRIVRALDWMASYTDFHGVQAVQAFRSTNREAGAGSMLLAGRYELMMDGQWRVAELDAAQQADPDFAYGVVPLPYSDGGRQNAGWVNGNFFIVPRSCHNPQGAWAFMKFWSGFDGHAAEAAESAAAGGWIPASQEVVKQPAFQRYLQAHPNFRLFVELANSPHQQPTPTISIQAYLYERVNRAAEEALTKQKSAQQALDDAQRDIEARLQAVLGADSP